MATETAILALFLPVQSSNRYKMVQVGFLAANHVHIVRLCGLNWNRKQFYPQLSTYGLPSPVYKQENWCLHADLFFWLSCLS